jgi:hypothetical protein
MKTSWKFDAEIFTNNNPYPLAYLLLKQKK